MTATRGGIVLWALVLSATAGRCGAISVIGSLSQQSTALPGETVRGSIQVRNHSDRPQVVQLSQTDYECRADGRCLFGEPGASPRSNAVWIALTTSRLELAAQQSGTVQYTVQIPRDAKLVGTYWSIIMVAGANEPPAPGPAGGKPTVGVQQVLRYGVQIVTDIGQTGRRQLQLSGERLEKSDQRRCFVVAAENTGERSLLPQAWVELFDDTGRSAGRFAAEPLRIFPGCSVRFQFDLSSVTPGQYRGLLVLDNRDESVFGAQYQFDLR